MAAVHDHEVDLAEVVGVVERTTVPDQLRDPVSLGLSMEPRSDRIPVNGLSCSGIALRVRSARPRVRLWRKVERHDPGSWKDLRQEVRRGTVECADLEDCLRPTGERNGGDAVLLERIHVPT